MEYDKQFETLKAGRKLCWLPHLGNVSLDLAFHDSALHFDVNPLMATIIMLFDDEGN